MSRTYSLGRKVLGITALATTGALVLAACTSDPEPTETSSTTTAAGDPLAGSSFSMTAPITEAGDSPFELIIEAYTTAYPDRSVELNEVPNDGFGQAVRTQLQAGNADDIIYVTPGSGNPQSIVPFAEAGLLASLSGTSAESTVPASNLSEFSYDGQLYGQGLDLTVVSVVSNKTAMDADGVTWPATYGELLELCGTVAANGKSLYVVAGSAPPNTGLTGMTLAASRVYAEIPDWNQQRWAGTATFAGTPEWQDTLNALLEMDDAGCFQDGVAGGDFGSITVGLGSGTSYGGFIPSGAAFGLAAETGNEFTVDAFPGTTADNTRIFGSINNALALTASAANPEAALAFLDWLAQPENVTLYAQGSGNLPLGDITADSLPPAYAPIADYVISGDYVVLPNQSWANGEVYIAFGTGIQGLFTGQTTVDEVLTAMDEAWDQ